ncbi:hypothetical protein ABDK96_02035 [Citricoccus nitrophenolicus]|uniref:Portal protein n=1 Tax=Citricoccus nitrophenolicus TaxID=863575 RepID=A0ABV0IE80_9MICC
MGILQTIGLRPGPAVHEARTRDREVARLQQEVEAGRLNFDLAMESIADLAREDVGWASIGMESGVEADRSALVSNANLVRAFSGMNPLMVRAKHVRAAYVWGQGCTVESADEDVQAVVTAFFEDRGNQDAVFGGQARMELEHDLFDDGNVFVGHWVDPMTGGVRVRTIPFTEITEIHTAPGDRSTPQFYRREWTEQDIGGGSPRTLVALYPALDYDPVAQPKQAADGTPILWPGTVTTGKGLNRHSGAAVYHVKVNGAGRGRKWGVGDGFAAMPWARAYKGFLEDCARLYHSLAKIAHIFSGTKDKAQMKRMAENSVNGGAGGAAFGNDLTVSTPNFTGMDPSRGRPFAAMVASAVGLAVTILTADPGQEGARAVAETLDTPQRLLFEARQGVWADFYRASVGYRIKQSVDAPRGELRGTVKREGDRTTALINGDAPVVTVDFPSIEDDNLTTMVEAVQKADATGKLPPLEVLRLLLRAFKIEDADAILDEMTDDDGNWIDPNATAADAAGQAAANALRNGGNPADVL